MQNTISFFSLIETIYYIYHFSQKEVLITNFNMAVVLLSSPTQQAKSQHDML